MTDENGRREMTIKELMAKHPRSQVVPVLHAEGSTRAAAHALHISEEHVLALRFAYGLSRRRGRPKKVPA